MKEVYANTIVKWAVVNGPHGDVANYNELFPGAYRVETFIGRDNFMMYRVFDTEEEYIWYTLKYQ